MLGLQPVHWRTLQVTALALTMRCTISKGQCVKSHAAQVFRSMPAVAHFSAVRFDEENDEVSYKMQVSWHSRSTIACMPHRTFSMQDRLLAPAASHAGTYRCDNRSCMHIYKPQKLTQMQSKWFACRRSWNLVWETLSKSAMQMRVVKITLALWRLTSFSKALR